MWNFECFINVDLVRPNETQIWLLLLLFVGFLCVMFYVHIDSYQRWNYWEQRVRHGIWNATYQNRHFTMRRWYLYAHFILNMPLLFSCRSHIFVFKLYIIFIVVVFLCHINRPTRKCSISFVTLKFVCFDIVCVTKKWLEFFNINHVVSATLAIHKTHIIHWLLDFASRVLRFSVLVRDTASAKAFPLA